MEKIKIDIKGINESMEKVTKAAKAMDAIFRVKPWGLDFEVIAKDIAEAKNKQISVEFARCIAKMLSDNGVSVKMFENEYREDENGNVSFGVTFEGLDFTEHDKVFEDKISKLESDYIKCYGENKALKEQIAELELELGAVKGNRDDILKSFRKGIAPYVDLAQMHETISDKNEKIAELACENKKLEQRIAELESKKTRINLNDRIKVKLTPLGADIFYHQYDEMNKAYDKTIIEPHLPKVDNLGYTEFPLWDFIHLYGEHIGMAKPNVIEPIEIIVLE